MTNLYALTGRELAALIREQRTLPDPALKGPIFQEARRLRGEWYGDKVYMRGLIEFTSFCSQDCFYCGLRRGNRSAVRYRLETDQILHCCRTGYALGFRTFVLQGGEDAFFDTHTLCALIDAVKSRWPDCALTLSVGERPKADYNAFHNAGADRFLLRHESADPLHFARLHPASQTLESRKRCLYELREIGYQVGAGFMVGSPFQTAEHLASDLVFLRELSPQMVGIGPFIPHKYTPFAGCPVGSLDLTLLMLALTRLLLPAVLLPSTTALGSIHLEGRELGLRAGANVVMPNLSPPEVRESYSLYNGKLSMGAEAAEGIALLCDRIRRAGYTADFSRGDWAGCAQPPPSPVE